MTTVIRIDVRKDESDALALAATQQAKGFQVSVEPSMLAVWNWSSGAPTSDTVASDADSQVHVVITRVP